MSYKYFVAYTWNGGHGCAEVLCKEKIKTLDNVIQIQNELKEKNKKIKVCCVTNFILLEEIDDGDHIPSVD